MCREKCAKEDEEEEAHLVTVAEGEAEAVVGAQPLSATVVKMKLNTFLRDRNRKELHAHLNKIVMAGNQLLGEAYAFSNFHISRILEAGSQDQPPMIPKIDRSFFYRCLLSVSISNARASTLGPDFLISIQQFDAFRPDGVPKTDIRELNPLVADLSITMATMATNHLWMNLDARVVKYVKWKYPTLKGWWSRIGSAVTQKRKVPLDKLFPNRDINYKEAQALLAAQTLRACLPVQTSTRFATRAFMTLPLYHLMLRHTEEENAQLKHANVKKRRSAFTLLPTKSGYTLSYIPVSTQTWVQLLKRVKSVTTTAVLEPGIRGDGRTANHRCLWDKYCNLGQVETVSRKFDRQITTDGYGVSILMVGRSSPMCAVPDVQAHPDLPADTVIKGVDPGMKDYVTAADNRGGVWKCSSGEFMHRSGMSSSARKTHEWNASTSTLTSNMPSPETTTVAGQETYLRAYLSALPQLLIHRASSGYRKMRFMRFCRRKSAIAWLCSKLAPATESQVMIGFGDWSGGSQSPISRRCAAPLKDIKHALQQKDNVILEIVKETLTSQVCHCCHQRMCQMKAGSTVWKRDKNSGKRGKVAVNGSVHKVLHCRNSAERSSDRCGTTWDRDVNAAKNILMLTTLAVWGQERPVAFTSANFLKGRRTQDDGSVPNPTKPTNGVPSVDPEQGIQDT